MDAAVHGARIMYKFHFSTVVAAFAMSLMVTLPAVAFGPPPNHPTHYRGAPGPLLGAGLPIILLAGGGYLIVRRLRRKSD